MSSLRAFEMTLKQMKKEKFISFKTVHEDGDTNDDDNEDELALLTKNFLKFWKNAGKSSKFGRSFPKPFQGKKSSTP